MRGLLLKDLYMTWKYSRWYMVIIGAFLVASPFVDNLFYMTYPFVLIGMMPVTLLSYDAQSRWERFAGALPYSRDHLVGSKYLMGLLCALALVLIAGAVRAGAMALQGNFRLPALAGYLALGLGLSLAPPSLILPLVFRFGVEKGRLAYMIAVGVLCGGGAAMSMGYSGSVWTGLPCSLAQVLAIVLGTAALYTLSWRLSTHFYRKREIG